MLCYGYGKRLRCTDLKIDWIWHLLINVLRILKPEISSLAWRTIQIIGPTLLYFSSLNKLHYKSHFSRFYSIYIYYKSVKGIKTRKCDFVILKYSKVGPITPASIFNNRCHIQSIFRSLIGYSVNTIVRNDFLRVIFSTEC